MKFRSFLYYSNSLKLDHFLQHEFARSLAIAFINTEELAKFFKNAKKIKFRYAKHKFKSVAKVTPGRVETLRDKKLRERALKAGRYLIKKETHKDPVSKKTKTPKPKKPVQQTLKFAA